VTTEVVVARAVAERGRPNSGDSSPEPGARPGLEDDLLAAPVRQPADQLDVSRLHDVRDIARLTLVEQDVARRELVLWFAPAMGATMVQEIEVEVA
jgi:hypothetical protein